MKTKLCWVPFIPITLLMIFIKYIEATLPSGETFLGMDWLTLVYINILLVPALFLICVVISLFDKKTAPYYALSKNYGAAIFAIVAAVAIIFRGVLTIMNTISTGSIAIFNVVTAAFAIVSGVAMLYIASCHMSGKNCGPKNIILLLFPTIWAAMKIIMTFLSYVTVSVLSRDMLDLLCYALIGLFFISCSMMIGNVEGKNSVKRCFIFGFPLIAAVFAYCTKSCIEMFNNISAYEIFDFANVALLLSIALYALFVLIELTLKAKTKEQIVLVSPEEQIDEYARSTIREEVKFYDEYIEDERIPNKDHIEQSDIIFSTKEEDIDYNIMKNNGNDFITSTGDDSEIKAQKQAPSVSKAETQSNISVATKNNPVAPVVEEPDFVVAPKKGNDDELETRMDEIDKLIFEIQSKKDENQE